MLFWQIQLIATVFIIGAKWTKIINWNKQKNFEFDDCLILCFCFYMILKIFQSAKICKIKCRNLNESLNSIFCEWYKLEFDFHWNQFNFFFLHYDNSVQISTKFSIFNFFYFFFCFWFLSIKKSICTKKKVMWKSDFT